MKSTIITLFIAIVAVSAQAQSKSKPKSLYKHPVGTATITPAHVIISAENIYSIPSDKNIDLLYGLLQAGYQAVQKSDDFSKTQVKQYMAGLIHLDSLLRPQIVKFHPDTAKKGKKE